MLLLLLLESENVGREGRNILEGCYRSLGWVGNRRRRNRSVSSQRTGWIRAGPEERTVVVWDCVLKVLELEFVGPVRCRGSV